MDPVSKVGGHRRSQWSGGQNSPQFLAYLVISCFEVNVQNKIMFFA